MFRSKKPTRLELTRTLANRLAASHVKDAVGFEDLPLAEWQSRRAALAEWHALMVSITTYSLWASLGSEEKVLPILEAFRPAFLDALDPEVRESFLKIPDTREKNYVMRLSDVLNDEGQANERWTNLIHLMASTITGHYHGDMKEPDALSATLTGTLIPGGPDLIEVVALGIVVSGGLEATRRMFDNLQREVPRLFSGPLT